MWRIVSRKTYHRIAWRRKVLFWKKSDNDKQDCSLYQLDSQDPKFWVVGGDIGKH